VLLRLLNAGLKTRLPSFSGFTLEMVAEDGNLYPFAQQGVEAELYAGKTVDAIAVVPVPATTPCTTGRSGSPAARRPAAACCAFLQVVDPVQFPLNVTHAGNGVGQVRSTSAPAASRAAPIAPRPTMRAPP